MDRDEILRRSREENRQGGEYELEAAKKAAQLSWRAGLLACCIIAVLESALAGRVNFTCWTIYFTALSSNFWAQYRSLRQGRDFYMALLYTALGLFFAALFIMDLVG